MPGDAKHRRKTRKAALGESGLRVRAKIFKYNGPGSWPCRMEFVQISEGREEESVKDKVSKAQAYPSGSPHSLAKLLTFL